MNLLFSSSNQPAGPANLPRTTCGRPHQNSDQSAKRAGYLTILGVDDDSSVAEMLKTALNVWGYDVILASNGREGLQVLDRQIVDGILLDVDMPVMDGPTMLDEVRWLRYQMPVVVMSGDFDERALWKLVKEGAQGFAFKPFSLRSLQELCATVFAQDRLGVGSDDHAYVS